MTRLVRKLVVVMTAVTALVLAACVASFTSPTSHVRLVAWAAASTVPPKKPTGNEVQVLAQLPKNLWFDGYGSPPVLTDGGREAVALLGTGTGSNGNPPERLAAIDLSDGKVTLGERVAGIANLFTGNNGQVYLVNVSGSSIGHVELWRVGSNLKPVPILRLPFTEATAKEGAPTDPAIAVATNENQAWIADGKHVELVDLANGHLMVSRPAPHGIYGNVTSIAKASQGGPLYLTFCLPRPSGQPLFACGAIAEVNPTSWTVIAERRYGGPVSYGRYGLVATSAGAWLSAGGGGNGVWMDFFATNDLRPDDNVVNAIGQIWLLSSGDTVWVTPGGSSSAKGPVSCLSASASGNVKEAAVTSWSTPNYGDLLGACPFGVSSSGPSLLLAAGRSIDSIHIPKACDFNG
jgi:hypothetical protein